MKTLCLYFIFCLNFHSFAQSLIQLPREKVYLNVSKPYYFAGENLKLDAFIVDAQTLRNDTLSVPLYLELIDNKRDSLIERWILKIVDGKVNTTITIPGNLKTNYYQIRAYTNWMRNFSSEAFSRMDLLVFSQNYKKDIPEEVSKSVLTNLNVYPESGICVNGLVNNLFVQTTDNFGKGIKAIVALKSDTTTVRIFDTNDNGEALVQFEATSGKSYYFESESLKTPTLKTRDEGVIMRGYYVNEGRKLSIIIQNNLKNIEPLKMMLQIRGDNFYNTLIEPKNITFFNLKTDSIPEGILNVALVDLDGKIVCKRSFLNVQQDKSSKENYLLFNSELDSPIEFTDKFFTNIQRVNAEMINKRNVVYDFEELQKTGETNNFITHKNELGISVSGKINDKEAPKSKELISVSLVIKPEDNDTLNKKQIFAVLAHKNGDFSFENLDFYGKVNLEIKANLGKKMFDIKFQNDVIPPFLKTFKSIDWRIFKEIFQEQNFQQKLLSVVDNVSEEEKIKTKELQEVTVFSKRTIRSPFTIFSGEPSARFLPSQLVSLGSSNTFQDFFNLKVAFRLTKHLNPVIKIFVDDFPVNGDVLDVIPLGTIAYVDIYDGSADANVVNASILINIYTKGYYTNPMVAKILEKENDSSISKIQRIGYYLDTTK